MFGTVLISIGTILHIYIFWRISSIPFVKKRFRLGAIICIGLLLWVLFFSARYLGHNRNGFFWAALELLGMNWMAVLFLIFVLFLAADLLTCFGLIFSSRAPAIRGWALLAGIMLSLIACVQGFRPPVVEEYGVAIRGLPVEFNGLRIAAIGDTHIGSLIGERWLSARVNRIMALRPDIVFLLGDIVEGYGANPELVLPQIKRLSAPLGVFAVPGNHEFHGETNSGKGFFEETGIKVIRDQWVEVGNVLTVAGVDYSRARRGERKDYGHFFQDLAERAPGPVIMLSHSPSDTEKAADAGVDLMLCGHTHGGQIWPFDYLVRISSPMVEGRYDVKGMPVIVSRGAGTWGPRMRLWSPGEILLLTLYAEANGAE
jgi:predicted MPP superfamily phosphohydrolase